VISELIGVPAPDRDEVRRLADLVVHREAGVHDVPPAGMAAALELVGYYTDLVGDRRRRPADDLTTALLAAEVEGDRLTDEEVVGFLFLMVVAGNETTTKLLGNAVHHISRHPAQREAVFADPGLIGPWIEETLRYDASSQLLARHTLEDVSVGGITCPAGSKLLLNIGAANHDEQVFAESEEYDIHRGRDELSQHIAFGGGRHYCLGANLARLEANTALEELVRRCSSIETLPGAERFYSANVRGFASLPVRVTIR
jgi:cytochrome P450